MSKRKFSSSSSSDQPRKRQRTNDYNNKISKSPTPNFDADCDSENIGRPQTFNSTQNGTKEVRFQQIDTDYYIGFDPLFRGNRSNDRTKRAIIRLYGVTNEGESVCCHCVDFQPYFYCTTWPGFVRDRDEEIMKRVLDNKLAQNAKSYQKCDEYVTDVVTVEKQTIWGYQFGKTSLFLKIFVSLPTLVPTARNMIKDGIYINSNLFESQTFESNMTFILRFV